MAIDAFSLKWNQWDKIYIFPPFSLIQRVLQKLNVDEAEALVIVPDWPTAVWYPQMMRRLVAKPVLIPKTRRTLVLPQRDEIHPLHRKLQLLAVQLSGKQYLHKVFWEKQERYCAPHGGSQHKNSMGHTLESGKNFVLKGRTIPFTQL